MAVVTDALPDEGTGGDTSPGEERTDRITRPDPFRNEFRTETLAGDAGSVATGLTILKMLGDLL